MNGQAMMQNQGESSIRKAENPESCWSRIGNVGDGSCPELDQVIRCQNCPVYTSAGRHLLDREQPQDYAIEWTDLQARDKEEGAAESVAAIVFRLGHEWLALPAAVFKEIAPVRTVHTLPHRSGPILLGIVNVHGALRLCISLHVLLGVERQSETAPDRHARRRSYARMAVIERDGHVWVFSVDEVLGVHRVKPDHLQNVPSTVARSASNYTRGLLKIDDKIIGYLDEELVFYSLKRSIL